MRPLRLPAFPAFLALNSAQCFLFASAMRFRTAGLIFRFAGASLDLWNTAHLLRWAAAILLGSRAHYPPLRRLGGNRLRLCSRAELPPDIAHFGVEQIDLMLVPDQGDIEKCAVECHMEGV